LVDRLGIPGDRGLSREQAEEALETGDPGQFWFRGVDADLKDIVVQRDLERLLAYGVRSEHLVDGWGHYGFLAKRLPVTADDAGMVGSLLTKELDAW
jgi:hypothetical protein